MVKHKVLVVEDDPELQELIRLYLTKYDYQVLVASDGKQALDLFQEETPDLVILDVMLPKLNGLEVCQSIRATSHIPILFLSSKSESEDIVKGLEFGGDSYLTKPFDPIVLIAKVKASFRRQSYTQSSPGAKILSFGDLVVDLQSYEVRLNNVPISLSAKELQLLLFLTQNPNQVFSTQQIYTQVWGSPEYGDVRTVMVHMSHLRKKIEADPSQPRYIITIRGFGYKFLGEY